MSYAKTTINKKLVNRFTSTFTCVQFQLPSKKGLKMRKVVLSLLWPLISKAFPSSHFCYQDLWLGDLTYPAMLHSGVCPIGTTSCFASTVVSKDKSRRKVHRFGCGEERRETCAKSRHGDFFIRICAFEDAFYSNGVIECSCDDANEDAGKTVHLCYAGRYDPDGPREALGVAACPTRDNSSLCSVRAKTDFQGRKIVEHDCFDGYGDRSTGCKTKLSGDEQLCVFSGMLSNVDDDCECSDPKWKMPSLRNEFMLPHPWPLGTCIFVIVVVIFVACYFAFSYCHLIRRFKEAFVY